MKKDNNKMNRRTFLKTFSLGSASVLGLIALEPLNCLARNTRKPEPDKTENNMTYRVNHHTGDKVSLLGYGMMRLPMNGGTINQDLVNQEVDYAIAHGVNYFDTAPVYCGGRSEAATGIALSRHPREKYLIATKMSNFDQQLWALDKAKEMYENSFKELKVDHIDYYLLHSVGGGGMETLKKRFIDNGLLDFLLAERKKGRIRNLGFSYHGDVEVYDWLVDHQDEYQWDFCQIEMNYVDWRHASKGGRGRKQDADAEYLYAKAEKAGIQNVVMEPLLGGRLARVPEEFAKMLKEQRPDHSIASWAFRWVGTYTNILVTLSGMTTMEVLQENVKTFSPLDPCSNSEKDLLARIADGMSGYPTIPCTACRYCMPCPYGVDIPGNFTYYNEAVNKKLLPLPAKDAPEYAARLKEYRDGFQAALPEGARADQCMDCEECLPKCPQQIRIPNQMGRLVELVSR